MQNILIIEDDQKTREELNECLILLGILPIEAKSAKEAIKKLGTHKPDFILMDLGLPDMDGKLLLRIIQELKPTPTIVITGREDIEEKIECFEAGALDYIVKPYDVREVMVRLMRHLSKNSTQTQTSKTSRCTIDIYANTITLNDKTDKVTPKELAIFEHLYKNHKRVVSKDEINQIVFNGKLLEGSRTIDYHIANLRKKFEENPSNPRHIKTIYGEGFIFVI